MLSQLNVIEIQSFLSVDGLLVGFKLRHFQLTQDGIIIFIVGGGGAGGGHFHSKVIGMLVVFLGYKIPILVFFRVFWKMLGKLKPFFPKQPSKRP